MFLGLDFVKLRFWSPENQKAKLPKSPKKSQKGFVAVGGTAKIAYFLLFFFERKAHHMGQSRSTKKLIHGSAPPMAKFPLVGSFQRKWTGGLGPVGRTLRFPSESTLSRVDAHLTPANHVAGFGSATRGTRSIPPPRPSGCDESGPPHGCTVGRSPPCASSPNRPPLDRWGAQQGDARRLPPPRLPGGS